MSSAMPPNEIVKASPEVAAQRTVSAMEGGGYYNQHSAPQRAACALGFPVWANACRALAETAPAVVRIADFGSSQGRNSVAPMKLALSILGGQVEITHQDLPANDFNALIRLVNDPAETYVSDPKRVFAGARGGSFYRQQFPDASLHLAWSAIATHWMASIPNAPVDHVLAHRASNGPNRDTWIRQAREEWRQFLHCRARELVRGGQFVQVGISRDAHDLGGTESFVELIVECLQGILAPEQLRSLVFPIMHRSREDWLDGLAHEDVGFRVAEMTMTTTRDPHWEAFQASGDVEAYADAVVGVARAAYMAGLVGGRFDLKDFYAKFRAALIQRPERGRAEWSVVLMRCERI
jgi:hypothetical protein